MMRRAVIAGVLGLVCGAVAAPAVASPNAAHGASKGHEVHEGRRRDEAYVGQMGATLEVANRIRLVLPSGLPIGSSRLLKLRITRRRPTPRQVGEGFLPLGPAVRFSGALDASDNPLELSMRARKLPRKPRYRYAIAVEHADVCTEDNDDYPLPNGLCRSWRIDEAKRTPRGLQASVEVTGGRRLQFGMVPAKALAD